MSVLDEYLQAEYEENQDEYFERRLGEYHASATGNCIRRNFLDFINDVRPDDDAWPHFEIGNRIEDVFEAALEQKHGWRYVKNSVPIELNFGNFSIVGETDPVVIRDNFDIDTLYEVKSTQNLGYTTEEPKRRHLYQAHCYMRALADGDVPDFDTKIVYINKSNLNTVTHDIDFDAEVWDDIVDRTRTLHNALISGQIPDPHEDSDLQDYFCEHGEKCCKNVT